MRDVHSKTAGGFGPGVASARGARGAVGGALLLGGLLLLGGGAVPAAFAAADVAPSLAKEFSPSKVPPGGTTTLTFAITNGNGFTISSVAFTDTLPSGLTVGNSTSTACSGTLTTTAPDTISLSGASVDPGTCQFSVQVTVGKVGSYLNTTGPITAGTLPAGNQATAGLEVVQPVPALGSAGVIALALALGAVSLLALRRSGA